ncbi:extended synaptotagmin-2-like [Bacillus rossius redtenbacheri]|uniref:extended synaptotagmin-2-like n=1 Tax=Bacillus rossius redtenbacheri TaxID=93214 RepID=UPI002FDD9D80
MLIAFLEKHFHRHKTAKKEDEGGARRPQRADCSAEGGGGGGGAEQPAMDVELEAEPQDCDLLLTHRAQLDHALALVAAAAAGSWLLGAAGLSVAWMLLLLVLLVSLWKAHAARLLGAAVRGEEARVRRRRALRPDETAEWLNFLVNRWWVFSSPTLFTIMKERLEPLLNEAKPNIVERLELLQFSLGDQTPELRSVRAFDVTGGRRTPLSLRTLQRGARGAAQRRHRQVAVEAEVSLDGEDFCLVLHVRLFGRDVGVDLDVAVEKLNVCGKMYMMLTFNMDAPFPHITHLSFAFLEKPEVWFSIHILKAVQMMEVPLLKTWIHSLVMDALTTVLVDPGKVDVNLMLRERPPVAREADNTVVQGVLTTTFSTTHPECDDVRWLVATLGDQRHKTSPLVPRWQESRSFLVASLAMDQLSVKLKSKRLISSVTLAHFELPLAGYDLDTTKIVETVLHKKVVRASVSNIPRVNVRLEYTPVPPVQLDQLEAEMPSLPLSQTVSGVLFVYIHGADGLNSGDQGECNPYCMIFNRSIKIKTTHYVRGTSSPQWEAQAHFLVCDYTRTSLSFVLSSWSPNRMSAAGLLGLATLTLTTGEWCLVRRKLPLSGSSGGATITVSIVFRPVSSVSQSEPSQHRGNPLNNRELDEQEGFCVMKRNSNSWMQHAKHLLTHREQEADHMGISSLLAAGQGLMEVTLSRAFDLVSKDLNGFSDPYCELKVNGECKYKSRVKKKTLNPCWDETVIMGLPQLGETLEVVLWDHDTFGANEFLGNVRLSVDDIRSVSGQDALHCWPLQGVKSGLVELKIKVIADDSEVPKYPAISNRSADSSKQVDQTVDSQSRLNKPQEGPPPGNGSPTYSSSSSPRLPRASPPTPSPDEAFKKTSPEYSSFRVMKQKVKRGLKLRRFRSEVSVSDGGKRAGNGKPATVTVVTMEPSGGGESDATELLQLDGLSHAVSQPNILQHSPSLRPKRPVDLQVKAVLRPDRYQGVEGVVVQAQGIHVAHVAQLYCRVKFHLLVPPRVLSSDKVGRTLAKSRLLPAMTNPRFDLAFQIDTPDSVPRQAVLFFEVRSSGKEVLGSCRATLQDLLATASPDTNEVRTWLSLNNGASLEVSVAHGRELKKSGRKIFRSWSVHRIGRI